MIDDCKNVTDLNETQFESPPPPRFDETASANALPVEPISTSRVGLWIQRARDARQLLPARTKALALVLVGGLAIGTLGGTMLVRERSSSPEAAPLSQEAPVENGRVQEATAEQVPSEEAAALDAAAMALQHAVQTSSRSRHRRFSPRIQRVPRAYRVTVIR